MTRRTLFLTGALVLAAALARAGDAAATGKYTGWLACNACSEKRVANGGSTAPNRDCSQKCIREGDPMVFYDEATKTLLRVDNPDAGKGQESHHIEVTGTVDAKAKTIHVASIKVLEKYVAKCAMPPAEKP